MSLALVPLQDWELDSLLFDAYLAAMRPGGGFRPNHIPSVSQVGGMGHFQGGEFRSWDDAVEYLYELGIPVDYVEILKAPKREEYFIWVNDSGSFKEDR